jgi:probable addiction module antidote protein
MTIQAKNLKIYDTADYLVAGSQQLIQKYLAIAWEEMITEKDPGIFVVALGNVAKAKGMTEVAKQAGLARESLYRSIAQGSKVRFETVCKLMAVFNFTPTQAETKHELV